MLCFRILPSGDTVRSLAGLQKSSFRLRGNFGVSCTGVDGTAKSVKCSSVSCVVEEYWDPLIQSNTPLPVKVFHSKFDSSKSMKVLSAKCTWSIKSSLCEQNGPYHCYMSKYLLHYRDIISDALTWIYTTFYCCSWWRGANLIYF